MLERCSGGLTVILKQQDVLKPAVLLKIENAVAKCPQHVFNPFRGQGCETGGVVGSFDNHFMRPDTVHPVEHSFGLAVQRTFNAEGGKLVRYYTHRPPWRVPLGCRSSMRSWTVVLNLRRCLPFVAIAKGAESALQLHILPGKIAWALGSIRGNNHPAANNRIFSQLRHSRTSLSEQATNFILSRQRRITKQLNLRPAGWQTVIVYADHIETPLARRWKPGADTRAPRPRFRVAGGDRLPPPRSSRRWVLRVLTSTKQSTSFSRPIRSISPRPCGGGKFPATRV